MSLEEHRNIVTDDYFEVQTVEFMPMLDDGGNIFIERQTRTRFFVPGNWGEYCNEVPEAPLSADYYTVSGFPIQQIWCCEGDLCHCTLFFVRIHHRHHIADLSKEGNGQFQEEECFICHARIVHEGAKDEVYRTLESETDWDKFMLSKMNLTGHETIVDYVEGLEE